VTDNEDGIKSCCFIRQKPRAL